MGVCILGEKLLNALLFLGERLWQKACPQEPCGADDGVQQNTGQQHPIVGFARAQRPVIPAHETCSQTALRNAFPVRGRKTDQYVVQPAHAGARLISVPQINGMQ